MTLLGPASGLLLAFAVCLAARFAPRDCLPCGRPASTKADAPLILSPQSAASPAWAFGVALADASCAQGGKGGDWCVPSTLHALGEALRARPGGLQTEGIFRLAASSSEVNELKAALTAAPTSPSALATPSCEALAALIKIFLRELPDDLWAAVRPEIDQEIMSGGSRDPIELASRLPPMEKNVVGWTLDLMNAVVLNASENKMDTKAVSVVFAPGLMRPPAMDPMSELAYTTKSVQWLRAMLETHQNSPLHPPARTRDAAPSLIQKLFGMGGSSFGSQSLSCRRSNRKSNNGRSSNGGRSFGTAASNSLPRGRGLLGRRRAEIMPTKGSLSGDPLASDARDSLGPYVEGGMRSSLKGPAPSLAMLEEGDQMRLLLPSDGSTGCSHSDLLPAYSLEGMGGAAFHLLAVPL
ncbi:hypothetical protein AB1Y20_017877 [Prymnesium parvum]|uniref:Rho-GAP domain-containing protein n=1 Tax=Prymnesium parvum TaxID=97485 RepID=A0AB34JNR3_PRYPA